MSSSTLSSSASEEEEEEDNTVFGKAKRLRQNAPAWKKRLAKELLKPKLNRFPRRRVFSPSVNAIWGGDLMDIHQYSRINKNYTLVLVDLFSKYAWARPLKNKSSGVVARALADIFDTSKKSPSKLWTDSGTEFYNANVREILRLHNVQLYSTFNEPKSMVAERFIRTLRGKIESNFILTHNPVWYDILPELIREYNHSRHRSISMTPEEAISPENYQKVYDSLYNRANRKSLKQLRKERTPAFDIGDKVRISVNKRLFEKGSTANWSEEIFEVSDILYTKKPLVYKIKDLVNEEIEGAFYKEQLQKTDQDIYRVDRILRKRRKADGTQEVLVKWAGWPDKFNSWEPAADIMRSGSAQSVR